MKAKFLFAAVFFAAGVALHAQTITTTTTTNLGLNSGINGISGTFIGENAGSSIGTNNGLGTFNVFLGGNAGKNVTVGNANNFLGYEAGLKTIDGYGGVYIGYQAGYEATNSGNCVLIGYKAGSQGASTTSNVFIGKEAGYKTNYSYSVAIGALAGKYMNESYNTLVGFGAGYGDENATVFGKHNCYFGYEAGFVNIGSSNVMLGSHSGSATSNVQNSTFIGYGAGRYITEGSYNVCIGDLAGGAQATTTNISTGNTFVGGRSGSVNSTGSNNVFLGRSSGIANTSGSNNVYLGFETGFSAITGTGNVFIGNQAGKNETLSNRLYINNTNNSNPLIYGEFKTTGTGAQPGVLKFNAQKVGIGYDSSGAFGDFPALTFSDASSYRLFVRGGILAYQVRVRLESGWADYVFNEGYKLMSLDDTEKYIKKNGHLPNMPSAAEIDKDGLEMGSIAKLQQEKIEELTLHVIELNKQVEQLKAQNKELQELKSKVEQLLNKQ